MMLDQMGCEEAARLVDKGLEGAVGAPTVTRDPERPLEGATKVSTSAFGEAIIRHM